MVLSNDLTLTDLQLKYLLFSIGNVYSPLVEYVTDRRIYSVDVMKEMNTIHIYEWTKCKVII